MNLIRGFNSYTCICIPQMKVKGENGALRAKHRENKLDSYFAPVNGDLLINFINRTDTKQNWISLPGSSGDLNF